jgi:non-heme chloroperoxidase
LIQFTADDGETIHLASAGQGEPIVILHGWTSNHHEWAPFVLPLSEGHRLIRWDARGHGNRPLAAGSPTNVQRMARDLRNLLDHYQLANATLVGHSMGALIIWEYLREFGTAGLGKLCLIDQSPKLLTDGEWSLGIYGDFDTERNHNFIAELEADFAEAVMRLAAYGLNARARSKYDENARGWQRIREELRRQIPGPLIDVWKSLAAADYRAVLGTIDIPTLLVFGDESNFYSLAAAHYVRDHIAGSILRIYEGTDHSPHHWKREQFVRDLLDFVGA